MPADQSTDSGVLQFPADAPVHDLLVGPFTEWRVRVDGRVVPRLTGFPDGDKVALVIDGRFVASFAPDDARQAAWLIAQALAVGEGYSHLGAGVPGRPFAAQVAEIRL